MSYGLTSPLFVQELQKYTAFVRLEKIPNCFLSIFGRFFRLYFYQKMQKYINKISDVPSRRFNTRYIFFTAGKGRMGNQTREKKNSLFAGGIQTACNRWRDAHLRLFLFRTIFLLLARKLFRISFFYKTLLYHFLFNLIFLYLYITRCSF